jgi:hypothetical protein
MFQIATDDPAAREQISPTCSVVSKEISAWKTVTFTPLLGIMVLTTARVPVMA